MKIIFIMCLVLAASAEIFSQSDASTRPRVASSPVVGRSETDPKGVPKNTNRAAKNDPNQIRKPTVKNITRADLKSKKESVLPVREAPKGASLDERITFKTTEQERLSTAYYSNPCQTGNPFLKSNCPAQKWNEWQSLRAEISKLDQELEQLRAEKVKSTPASSSENLIGSALGLTIIGSAILILAALIRLSKRPKRDCVARSNADKWNYDDDNIVFFEHDRRVVDNQVFKSGDASVYPTGYEIDHYVYEDTSAGDDYYSSNDFDDRR